MRYRSANGLLRPKIEQYLATGKVISSVAANSSQIATLVERQTRLLMLVRVPSKDTKTVTG